MIASPPSACRPSARRTILAAAAVLACSGPLSAQEAAPSTQRTFSVVPTFTATGTYTSNANLSSTDRQSDFIAQISPGVRIDSRSGRIRGSLDYSLNALAYANDTSRNQVQHALSAAFIGDIVDNRLIVDARAGISQQSISAFGVQAVGLPGNNANRSEVRTYSVAPVLRGRIGDLADVQARLSVGGTKSTQSQGVGDSTSVAATVGLTGGRGPLGWSFNLVEQTTDYDRGRKIRQGSQIGGLSYVPDVDWRLSFRAGRESTDVESVERQSNTTWGAGVDWSPSPRTQVSVQMDRRYFGNGHGISVQHRMARSLIRFSDFRDASSDIASNGGQSAVSQYQSIYDALERFNLSPIERDLNARIILGQLPGGFLRSSATLSRRQELSMAWFGLRTSAVLTASRYDTRRLGITLPDGSDLTRTDRVLQDGLSASLGYRLTPTTGISLGATYLRTPDSGPLPGNEQKSVNFSLSNQFGVRTSVSMSLRHTVFDSIVQPYTETGASASISLRF